MITTNKIINEIIKKKYGIYKSFFPNSEYNFDLRKIKKFKKFKNIIVIGMGGSILGAKAIYCFLKHKIKKNFIFLDNLDHSEILKIKNQNNLRKFLFLIISKSGNTTETIINSSFFNPYLKKENVIIISEDTGNILSNFAKKNQFHFIKHDKNIGGRYSVFSDVGMIPAYLMGFKPQSFKKHLPILLKNKKVLHKNVSKFLNTSFKKNKILILFNYIPELKDFLFWLQQLLAESLGKNRKGFMPIVSNAPKDHHSLLQLYLDGPKDKIFYVFSSEDKRKLKVNTKMFEKKIKYLNKKKYENIKISQKNAFITVLKQKKIPYKEVIIKKLDEATIGRLFFLFIFQTIGLSKILDVNPFDQPSVESVKILTKKSLI